MQAPFAFQPGLPRTSAIDHATAEAVSSADCPSRGHHPAHQRSVRHCGGGRDPQAQDGGDCYRAQHTETRRRELRRAPGRCDYRDEADFLTAGEDIHLETHRRKAHSGAQRDALRTRLRAPLAEKAWHAHRAIGPSRGALAHVARLSPYQARSGATRRRIAPTPSTPIARHASVPGSGTLVTLAARATTVKLKLLGKKSPA